MDRLPHLQTLAYSVKQALQRLHNLQRIVDFQERVESLKRNGIKVNVRYVPTEVNVADIGT